MADIANQVMATVNAPYRAHLSARQLAEMIVDAKSAADCDASVFAFFSEVGLALQKQFINEMRVDQARVRKVAARFEEISGYTLPLAA